LIAEDDPELRSVLRRGLAEQGFAPETVATGGELLARVDSAPPDLLIIVIGLPDTDGRDLCQALRARGIQAPALFLTARDALPAPLVARPGETVRRRDLIRAGWPHGAIVHENTLDAYVARLRRKLRALDGAPPITTVHGVGYALQ